MCYLTREKEKVSLPSCGALLNPKLFIKLCSLHQPLQILSLFLIYHYLMQKTWLLTRQSKALFETFCIFLKKYSIILFTRKKNKNSLLLDSEMHTFKCTDIYMLSSSLLSSNYILVDFMLVWTSIPGKKWST